MMNRNKTMTIAAAALSGMLAGSAARAAVLTQGTTGTSHQLVGQLVAGAGQQVLLLDDSGKHDCKGKNACKGQGGCKSGDNGCKGKNSCSGKGGCNTNPPSTSPSPKL